MQSKRRSWKDNHYGKPRRRSCNAGKKVLLIDADPQGDLTTCLGWQDTDNLGITLATKLTDVINETMNDPTVGILHHDEGVDLVPANLELSAMEFNLVNAMSRETALRNYLSNEY